MLSAQRGEIITLRDQINRLWENWLIAVIVVLVLLIPFGGNLLGGVSRISLLDAYQSAGIASAEYARGYYPPTPISEDFAPDVQERKIVKSSSLSTEVERGKFKEAENKMLDVVESSGSFLLNQNVDKIGKDRKSYFVARYSIKVEVDKYDAVVSQLKDIGEVTSFNENQQDVTGRYENLNIEVDSEKAKLARYQELYEETKDVEFKIQLADRIFSQERRIKYLEDSLKNIDQRVDYSTISLTINEKRSDYADIVFVKFSELIKNFVGSLNLLLKFIFNIIPWLVALLLVIFVYRLVKRRF